MREEIIEFLKRELIGPDPVPPLIQENGEEILTNEPPRLRYGAGILFPQATLNLESDATDEKENAILEEYGKVPDNEAPFPKIDEAEHFSSKDDFTDVNDEIINLANAYLPSVIGFSCFTEIPEEGFSVSIRAGRYFEKDIASEQTSNASKKPAYFRESLDTVLNISKEDLPTCKNHSRNFKIYKDEKPTGLFFNVTNRSSRKQTQSKSQLLTFSLVNGLHSSIGHIDNENCFFQVGFSIKAKNGAYCFEPYPEREYMDQTKDEESIRLLYRNYKTYAVGHGCAPSWINTDGGNVSEIRAEIIPFFEMKPIVPMTLNIQLKMYELCDYTKQESLTSSLSKLVDEYEEWIIKQEIACGSLEEKFKSIAERHLADCRNCLKRISDGILLIQNDLTVRRAFCLMNRAMLMQQLRYRLKLREWEVSEDGILQIKAIQQPDISNPETWPDWSLGKGTKLGSWYPFQIAFILMNLRAMVDPQNEYRKTVDLIWFPTGGGKTEAYLGLSAFSIFLKRLQNKNDSGTTVLMRYTLRLLTAQQYQRAASLICACESIRREYETELGKDRITIGLWVGSDLTPNKRREAIDYLNNMSQGKTNDNPFIILKCPWCGAQMGPVYLDRLRIIGYKKTRRPSTIIFQCHNPECLFSNDDYPLPLIVIDEDIYDSPPSIVIGTIDKFAILPWRPEARTLFGFRDNNRLSPPSLIIQDELHLISGPLGSMAGHYETLIYELCKDQKGEFVTVPKIIASTATITRAAQQIHALYGCGEKNVFLFPPQCLDAGNSFFAHEDKNIAGRIYVGIHASGLSSHTTAQVRVMSALLQSIKSIKTESENKRDAYWTLVTYFNSLKELGHAATLIQADIREYLNAMWKRKNIHKEEGKDPRRFIHEAIELTSRIPSTEITQKLQELEISYPQANDSLPVDICLATNMISVGVDVQRLGLMAVIGQPKTTSEYIQATSRVGRSREEPGLIVVIFNTAKPRDRSHYEHFYSYHSAIYSHVEPTSVTPFSAPVRERALHAILVGFVRYLGSIQNRESPQPLPSKEVFRHAIEAIEKRVAVIDPEELENTLKLLQERIDEWARHLPPKYGDFYQQTSEVPLMYPAGMSPREEWRLKSWPTPTSLREIDAACDVSVIEGYPEQQEVN